MIKARSGRHLGAMLENLNLIRIRKRNGNKVCASLPLFDKGFGAGNLAYYTNLHSLLYAKGIFVSPMSLYGLNF